MPLWPFSRSKKERLDREGGGASPLNAVEAWMPHRFRCWLADPHDSSHAVAALSGLSARGEVIVEPIVGGEGRAGVQVSSRFEPRTAAVLRPLNALRQAGISVRGFEALDLVTDPDERAVERAVSDWQQFGNTGPYRKRLEILAGGATLAACLRHTGAAWRFATTCVSFNTARAEARILRAALEATTALDAEAFVNAAIDRATLTSLTGESFALPEDVLITLIGRRSYLGERATQLAESLPPPLGEPVTHALCRAVRIGGDHAATALAALHNADPSAGVRTAVEQALASADPNVRAAALGTLAHHWGTEARPYWQTFLASRSAPERQAAEAILGLYGTEEDLPLAAEHLNKIARARSAVEMEPPRGSEIIDLLVRNREHPVAAEALHDLTVRWDRLPDDLRGWLARQHSWLQVGEAAAPPRVEQASAAAERLEWPLPAITRDGYRLVLHFDATDQSQVRERFEELARAHVAVSVLDGDREWLALEVRSGEAGALIERLWAQAHEA
jgi:hypothetical protein